MITLYTTGCPKCKTLERQLKMKNIEFNTVTDIEEFKKAGLTDAPTLKIDDEIMNFNKALEWVLKQ